MNYRECEITNAKLPNGANGVEWSHENYDGSDNLLCGWAYNEEQACRQSADRN